MTFHFLQEEKKKREKNHVVTLLGNSLAARGRCARLSAAGLHCGRLANSGPLTVSQPIPALRESRRLVGGVPNGAPLSAGSGFVGVAGQRAKGGGLTEEFGQRLR